MIYSNEFKERIVKLYSNGKSITLIFNEYHISRFTIYKWIKNSKKIINQMLLLYVDISNEFNSCVSNINSMLKLVINNNYQLEFPSNLFSFVL